MRNEECEDLPAGQYAGSSMLSTPHSPLPTPHTLYPIPHTPLPITQRPLSENACLLSKAMVKGAAAAQGIGGAAQPFRNEVEE
jgi:hypothetical protein